MFEKRFGFLAIPALMLFFAVSSLAFAEGSGADDGDATITAQVREALQRDKKLEQSDISVDTSQGAVQLTGNVESQEQDAEAVKIVNQIEGVRLVRDSLVTSRDTEQN